MRGRQTAVRVPRRGFELCRGFAVLAVVGALLLAVGLWFAFAQPEHGLAVGAEDTGASYSAGDSVSQDDIGSLSNRFKSLDALERATDETDNVVTSTRVGVLIAVNRALDGATVSFSGEVVGDIMNADADHKWLNVLGSDGSCIGVLVDNDMAQRVTHVGGYSTTGTTLQVRGVYSVDCVEHQGELDVHAVSVRVLDAGGTVTHFADKDDVVSGLRLCGIAFVLMMIFFIVRHIYDRREHNERKARLLGGALDNSQRLLDIFRRAAGSDDGQTGRPGDGHNDNGRSAK